VQFLDAHGKPLDTPEEGGEFVLPPGGKVLDAKGNEIALAPGATVLVPSPETPTYFRTRPEKPAEEKPLEAPAPQPKPEEPGPAQSLTPGAFLPKSEPGSPKPVLKAEAKPEAQPKAPPAKAKAPEKKPKEPVKPPEEPVKPKKDTASRPGDQIMIPDSACEKHSVEFLEGCWRSELTLSDGTREILRFCFDKNGVGKRIDTKVKTKRICVTSVKAAWSGNDLSLSFGTFYCSDSRLGYDRPIVCNGCGDNTHCIGTEYKNHTIIGRTDFHITKE